MFYTLLRAYFRAALAVFYRRIEVEGAEHVPATGPLLIVANHPNALVDGLLVLTRLARPVSLAAKSTLADAPLVGLLFRAGNVVPIHRTRDVAAGADPRRNVDSMAEIQRRFAEGGALLLFPEGQSHGDPSMRRFRHGASRLALDYVASGDTGRLRILPVGLSYAAKARFRSRVLLRFGEPLAVSDWLEANPKARPRNLTNALRERMATLALEYADRDEAILLQRAADVLELRGEAPPTLGRPGPPLAERVALIERLRAGYRQLREEEPDTVADLASRVVGFRRRLRASGIAPRELHISMHPLRVLRFVLREGALLLVGLPLAAWGYLNHALPYLATRLAARRLAVTPDQVASYAVFGALVLFPLAYLLQLAVAWWRLPAVWAALYTVSLPLAGWFALRLGTRIVAGRRRVRAFVRLASSRREREAMVTESRALVSEIRGLAERLEGRGGGGRGGGRRGGHGGSRGT